tara:strand:- start:2729 stop:3616 length:888 start_codon:yes stop_codon:yes gene_type:complete
MKILVTGATGFVGKSLIPKLLSENHEVVVNLHNSQRALPDSVTKIRLQDAGNTVAHDIELLKALRLDGVIHLASLYITTHKPEEVLNLVQTNVGFSTYVLECASEAGVPWFVNTGTFWQHYKSAEYDPVNLYAATKEAFEAIAQYYINTSSLQFVTLKLSDTYGPGDTRPKILNLLDRISKSDEELQMSPGDQQMDISHIDDVCTAFIQLANLLQNADKRIENGAAYVVKASKVYSLKELVAIFENVSKCKLSINFGGRPYRDREVMQPWKFGNTVPGWSPKISIHAGIKQMLDI